MAENKRFVLFLLCTISSNLIVHLTQGRYPPALCRIEDTSLASDMSQQYGTSFGKSLQIFPAFKETSNIVSERFFTGATIERIASFCRVIYSVQLLVEGVPEVNLSSCAAFTEVSQSCETSMSAPSSMSFVSTSAVPTRNHSSNVYHMSIKCLLRLAVEFNRNI